MKYKYTILIILILILIFGMHFSKAPSTQYYPYYNNTQGYQYAGDNNGAYSRFYDFTVNILNFNTSRYTYNFTISLYFYPNMTSTFTQNNVMHIKFFGTDTSLSADFQIYIQSINNANPTGCSLATWVDTIGIKHRITGDSSDRWTASRSYFKCGVNNVSPTKNKNITIDFIMFYDYSRNLLQAQFYINNTQIAVSPNLFSLNSRLYLLQLYIAKAPANTLLGYGEYAIPMGHFYTRVYTKSLNSTERNQNYYNPFNNYTKDKLLLDYTIGYFDSDLGIWRNKMNPYNSQFYANGRPWLKVINFDRKSVLMEELTTTIVSTTTKSLFYSTTITEVRDTTNYYCASLLFIPFAFGLLFYFIERRLILIGIGLGFIFLNAFLGVSYAYFLLGVFLIFLNVILLRYQIIEKD
jgi:hypothetical protein